jgi:hypothetical protein
VRDVVREYQEMARVISARQCAFCGIYRCFFLFFASCWLINRISEWKLARWRGQLMTSPLGKVSMLDCRNNDREIAQPKKGTRENFDL